MDKYLDIALVVVPILFSTALGILARRKDMLAPEEVRGLQQFVIRFGLPCLLFNSCLTAQISSESVSTMIMLIPLAFLAALWGFHARKKLHPYHNLTLLISGKETGMIGIPLFIVLFGAAQSYHMGVLDLAQGVITIPVVSILSAKADENPSPAKIAKQVAERYHLVFVPLQEKFDALAEATTATDWLNDGVHPTSGGHEMIAGELVKALGL